MKVRINVKGISNKQRSIRQLEYEYRDELFEMAGRDDGVRGENEIKEGKIPVRDFLAETVRITIAEYGKAAEGTKRPEDTVFLLMEALTKEKIEEKACEGKVAFGIHYNRNRVDEKKAVENAWQCFEDGMVALFVDDERYENMNDRFILHEGSVITFIRLTFLAGRMW